MKTLMRIAAFRTLAPDDGAGSGGAAPQGHGPSNDPAEVDHFSDAATEAAYEAATKEGANEEDPDEDDPPEEKGVADAPKPTEDKAPAEVPEEEAKKAETDKPADEPSAEIPADIIEKYPAVGVYQRLESELLNPETAPEALQWFAGQVAKANNTTVEALLGLAPAESKTEAAPTGEADWQELGFESKEEFDAQPEYIRMGYDSPGEYKIAKRLDALEGKVTPLATDRETQAKEKAEAESKANWEGAIQKIAPTAIAAIKSELGWEATPAQALEAARKFPEIASRPGGLKEAIAAAFVRDIAKANQARGRDEKSPVPPMPKSEGQGGEKTPDPDDWDSFSSSVAEQY